MGKELGTLRKNNAVDVDDLPTQCGNGVQRGGRASQPESRPRFSGVGVWKQSGRCHQEPRRQAKRRSMACRQRIGVAVAHRFSIVRNVDPAQPQRSAPGRSRCVSCPIPTRNPSVARPPYVGASDHNARDYTETGWKGEEAEPIMNRLWPSSKLKGWQSPIAFIRRKRGSRQAFPACSVANIDWSKPFAASISRLNKASSSLFWGQTEPAKPPRSNSFPASFRPPAVWLA